MKRQFNFALLLSVVGLGTPAFAGQNPAVAGASVEQIAETIRAANAGLSPDLAEVLKMADAGVDEKTILVYIENSPGFRLRADDIIYLHKQGISTPIVTALLQHPARTQIAQQPQMAPPAQQQQVANAPQVATAPVYVTPPSQPIYVQSPPVVYTDPYYYGYPCGYGYSYAPSVAVGIGLGFPFYSRPFFHGGGFHGGFHGGLHSQIFGGSGHFGGGIHAIHR